MNTAINKLKSAVTSIDDQQNSFDTKHEHGSADQTRAILFQSMMEGEKSDVLRAIKQLEILQI